MPRHYFLYDLFSNHYCCLSLSGESFYLPREGIYQNQQIAIPLFACPYLSEIYLLVLPWLFPSVPHSRVLPFSCTHQLACFASLDYLSFNCILSRQPQAGRLEKC